MPVKSKVRVQIKRDKGLQGLISQKAELFITTAVRTSNPIHTCALFAAI
jgi:hypothetical protein